MTLTRRVVQRLLRAKGYEVSRLDRPGKDPIVDIGHLLKGQAPRVILDVGANEGQTTEQFISAFPSAMVHSFEPFEPSFRKLSAIFAASGQVRAVQCA